MKIVEPSRQIERIKKIIFNDIVLSGLPSNERVDIYYLSEKNGVVYIMDSEEDFIESKNEYNPVGTIDLNVIEYSDLDEYLKGLFYIHNLILN